MVYAFFMFKLYKNWQHARRNKKLEHPARVSSSGLGAELYARLEKTGIENSHHRKEIYRDPNSGRYWLSEYAEQGQGSWYELTSLDHDTAQAILQSPDMLTQFCESGKWGKPHYYPLK